MLLFLKNIHRNMISLSNELSSIIKIKIRRVDGRWLREVVLLTVSSAFAVQTVIQLSVEGNMMTEIWK